MGSLAGMCRYRLTDVSLELEGPYGPVELARYGAPAPPAAGPDARGVDA